MCFICYRIFGISSITKFWIHCGHSLRSNLTVYSLQPNVLLIHGVSATILKHSLCYNFFPVTICIASATNIFPRGKESGGIFVPIHTSSATQTGFLIPYPSSATHIKLDWVKMEPFISATNLIRGVFPPYFGEVLVVPSCQATFVQQAGNWPRILWVNLAAPLRTLNPFFFLLLPRFFSQKGNVTRRNGPRD